MDRLIEVEEVPNDKDIVIRFTGTDLRYQASGYKLSVYLTQDEADRIAFHLTSILQDRKINNKLS